MIVYMSPPETRGGWLWQAIVIPTCVAALITAPIWYRAFASPDTPSWIPITAIVLGSLASLGLLSAVIAPSFMSVVPDDWPTWRAIGVFMTMFIAIPAGGVLAGMAGDNLAFQDRGTIVGCEIRKVDQQVEHRPVRDGNGSIRYETVTYYDHALTCEVESVTELTTDTALGRQGDHIDVEYDSSGRLDPRHAEERWNWTTLLWVSIATLIVGLLARASVFRR